MPDTTPKTYRPKGGRPPASRLVLDDPFLNRLRFGAEPIYLLAMYAGYRHQSNFSGFISSGVVRATPQNIHRFQQLARTINWNEPIFVEREVAP